MSAFLGEQVHRVPARSTREIIEAAKGFLSRVQPEMLARPMPLDHRALMSALECHGIFVTPVPDARLPGAEGETFPNGDHIEILLPETTYDTLEQGGPFQNRARATLAHEVGHAFLHIPALPRLEGKPIGFRRVSPHQIPAYESSEWQAWAFAGALLAPPRTLLMLGSRTPATVARIYSISAEMAASHLRRLRML